MIKCCAGSSVEWENVFDGTSGTVDVQIDGPNSSCAQL